MARPLAFLPAVLGLLGIPGGCKVDPTGEDATLEVLWCVYGQEGDADWCGLAGIDTVQMVVNNDPVDEFTWPCPDGSYESDGEVLESGDYVVRFEGVDQEGYVVASTHDPKVTEGDTVTVNGGDRITLRAPLDAGQVGDVEVDLRFEPPGGGPAVECETAGVTRVGYEFCVDGCGGGRRGEGIAVYLGEDDGGVSCDRAGTLGLEGVPFGAYSIVVNATDDAGTMWAGECSGLVLQEEHPTFDACEIPVSDERLLTCIREE